MAGLVIGDRQRLTFNVARHVRSCMEEAEGALREMTRACGAVLPSEVLGYDVHACVRANGHEGEHAAPTWGLGCEVRWLDGRASTRWTPDNSDPLEFSS